MESEPPVGGGETDDLLPMMIKQQQQQVVDEGYEEEEEEEEEKFERAAMMAAEHNQVRPFTFIKSLITECLCEQFVPGGGDGGKGFGFAEREQFVQIHGIEFIGLGAITDELTAKERVYDTLEQIKSRPTERLISIGYLSSSPSSSSSPQQQQQQQGGGGRGKSGNQKKITETIPLDLWTRTYPDDRAMSRQSKRIIANIKSCNYDAAIRDVQKQYNGQKRRVLKGNNFFKLGISAHNLGVLSILAGRSNSISSVLFQEAVAMKKRSFGDDHPEVAVSLDELGIQYFAQEQYQNALLAFQESKTILEKNTGGSGDSTNSNNNNNNNNSKICMLQNNIACCYFVMGNLEDAAAAMNQALELQKHHHSTTTTTNLRNNNNNNINNDNTNNYNSSAAVVGSNTTSSSGAQNDLDLLHMAIVLNNYGYLKANQKQYENASAYFEEALLVSLIYLLSLLLLLLLFDLYTYIYACFFFSFIIYLFIPFLFKIQIQQSVLGDAYNHRAIRDSQSNLDFTNAFHHS